MKKIVIKIFIIFSLTLNFVFIFHYLKTDKTNNPLEFLNLNLSSNQKESINKLKKKYHKKNEELKRKIYHHQIKLLDMLKIKNTNDETINNRIEKINLAQKQIEAMTVKEIFEIKKILNPRQCNYLAENLRKNIEHNTVLCKKACCNTKMRGETENELNKDGNIKKNKINIQ